MMAQERGVDNAVTELTRLMPRIRRLLQNTAAESIAIAECNLEVSSLLLNHCDEDRALLREALRYSEGALEEFTKHYDPSQDGYYDVVEAAVQTLNVRSSLFRERVDERTMLQQLILLCFGPTSELALRVKHSLADAWTECGETGKARGMLRWLKQAETVQQREDDCGIQEDLDALGATTSESEESCSSDDEPRGGACAAAPQKKQRVERGGLLPFCDGKYRCSICNAKDGRNGYGYVKGGAGGADLFRHFKAKHPSLGPPTGVRGVAGHVVGCDCAIRSDRPEICGGPVEIK